MQIRARLVQRKEQNRSRQMRTSVKLDRRRTYQILCQWSSATSSQLTYQHKSVKVAKCRLLTTHSGVCCCVSYTNTASCVATAYTILYGNANAGCGPSETVFGSASCDLGDGALVLGAGVGTPVTPVTGGGSMAVCVDAGFWATMGAGRGGMSSAVEDVSIVMFWVGAGSRRLYRTGEHLTAIDGRLCPGKWAIGGLSRPPLL